LEENDELDAKVDVNLLLFLFKSSALSIARREQIIVVIIVLSLARSLSREKRFQMRLSESLL
jgi:uncharacterized protein Smg (DUF494 family)